MISEGQIKKLLDREDVENLLAVGAPQDEYETEAQMIRDRVVDLQQRQSVAPSTQQITDLIRSVWIEMFGPFETDHLNAREPMFLKIATVIRASLERQTEN